MQQQRTDFCQQATTWLAAQLKWLDEMGSQLNLTRSYGRALPGERVSEGVPSAYGSNYTLLGLLSVNGIEAPWLVEGALDGDLFHFYIAEAVAPTLAPGDLLLLDNLATHKVEGIAEVVAARGARVVYLPPYSPDLNPLERCWSKIKTYLRKAKARSYEALLQALKEALATITDADARAWFEFCGYPVQ